jgi:hypothetical protein
MFRTVPLRAAAFTLVLGCAGAAWSAEWVLKPGISADKVTGSSTWADLQKAYGADAKLRPFPGVEGERLPGAVLFSQDPQRTLELAWKEGKEKQAVELVRVRGKSHWRTPEGITPGMTLAELVRINGAPVKFGGFEVDAGGNVGSYGKGRLSRYNFKLQITLDPGTHHGIPDKQYEKMIGDRQLSSSDPWVRKLNPRVQQVIIRFD